MSQNDINLQTIYDLLKIISVDQTIESSDSFKEVGILNNEAEKSNLLDKILFELEEIRVQMERLSWLNNHYRILHNFAQICSKTLNNKILLNKAYEMVSQVMPTDSFYIASYNEDDLQICFQLMIEKGEILDPVTINLGDNYTSKAIKTRETIHHKESGQLVEFDSLYGDETNSCLFVPVIIDDHVKGVISAQCYSDFAYRKEHEELLQIIGTQVFNSIETVKLYENIYKMSQVDELTGLKNYRAFHNDLESVIRESDNHLKLLMIDSDRLKKINDSYGHDIGDLYLKVLAEGIKSITNEKIEGYRYAGDEFMVIIRSPVNMDQLFTVLKNYYSHHPITTHNQHLIVSISMGAACYPIDGISVDSLKKSADTALYAAKKQGGNKIVFS